MKKRKLSGLEAFIASVKVKHPDYVDGFSYQSKHNSVVFCNEWLETLWVGYQMAFDDLPKLDLMVSVDMSNPSDESTFDRRVYSKIIEWNSFSPAFIEGGELSLCFVYQSHNFDIKGFNDPYVGRLMKKQRPD